MDQLSQPFSLEWGVAGRPLEGETESGDGYLVIIDECGAFIAVVDGIGHGIDAAQASRLATAALRESRFSSVAAAITHSHEMLRRTRGAAISLASFSAKKGSMTWMGVGNVDGLLFHAAPNRACETLLKRGGMVGYRLPALREEELPISRDDTLIFATDGIDDVFEHQPFLELSAQNLADKIFLKYAKQSDDALVLVARWKEVAS